MTRRGELLATTPNRGMVLLCAVALFTMAPSPVSADLNGRWRFQWSNTSVEVITQVGSNVSFPLTLPMPPGGTLAFSGSVTDSSLVTQANNPFDPGCPVHLDTTILAGELVMEGFIYTLCPPAAGGTVRADRCECYDGNSTNGDGCDSECQIEQCYSCSGDPSVCVPLADGAPCDDQMACTAGETCTATLCSGGSPVTPCIDMTGGWFLRYDYPDDPGFPVPPDAEGSLTFTQHNTDLETATMQGTINPSTGSFSLTDVNINLCGANHMSGVVAADGLTLTGTFSTPQQISFSTCITFQADVTGTRCGGGTLDPNEECDDGDATNGDGCNAQCEVEPCFTCSGSPSVCTPMSDATPCDDDEECTTADACQSGVCGGTAQPNGTSCSDDDICTSADTCAQGVCTGTPLACAPCQMCDGITPACVPRPDFSACDDGDPCTNGDICQAGACSGSPLFCPPCSACNGTGQCENMPRTGCLASTAPSRSRLAMTDASDPADDALSWTWRRSPGGPPPNLGDPTQGTIYALCVFDESTSPPTALITAPAQQLACPDSACWTSRRYGFSYRNNGDDNGLTRIDLRARADGRIRAVVRGKGSFLNPPTAPLSLPLRVQLHAVQYDSSNLQTCFEAEYASPGVRVNSEGVFRALGTGP